MLAIASKSEYNKEKGGDTMANTSAVYARIDTNLKRGYISDTDLLNIEECRVEWIKKSNAATKSLQRDMYFKHEIHYRIYRDWKDLEEYHIQSIEQLKGDLNGYGQ